MKSQDKSKILSPGCLNQGKAKVFSWPYFINITGCEPMAASPECSQNEEFHLYIPFLNCGFPLTFWYSESTSLLVMTLFGVFCHSGTNFCIRAGRTFSFLISMPLVHVEFVCCTEEERTSCNSSENLFLRCQSIRHYLPEHSTPYTHSHKNLKSRPTITNRTAHKTSHSF